MNDERLDELLEELRDEGADPEQVREAQERVWNRLASARSVACDDFRPALAAYAEGSLSESRRLLTEDHLSRCVDCRRALAEAKGVRKVVAMPSRRSPRRAWAGWAIAAGLVMAVLYIGWSGIDAALAPDGPTATVVAVAGSLYQPSGGPLTVGAELAEGEIVRTAASSQAVLRLRDGSRVEMNERTELAVRAALSGDTIRLDRGDIIVAAAEQGRDRLRVVTRDSIASVKGTVFAVSSGTAGSLVSVVEGSVEVSQGGTDALLLAGQQAASTSSVGAAGVLQAVSWSENANGYGELLAELAMIEEHLASSSPAMRSQARLVPFLPANPTVYVAIPNLEGTIDEALALVEQRAQQSEALQSWWLSESGRSMAEAFELLESVTGLLGEELLFVLSGSNDPMPLLMAEVRSGREDELLAIIEQGAGGVPEALPYQITDGLLLASDSPANLALLTLQLGNGAGSPFATEIAAHYAGGIGWLAAIDVQSLGAEHLDSEASRLLGAANMRYLIVEQRSGALGDESAATLSFDGERQGISSWIAAPGGIGSAEYISPDTIAASSGSTRDPYEALDQLFSALGPSSELLTEIAEMEADTGIDVRNDVAASLGTDFVLAIDGVSLVEPAFLAVFEVVNAGALDEAMRRLVDAVNLEIAAESGPEGRLTLSQEQVNGRTWNVLSSTVPGEAVTWTYDRGYLVGSTDRAVALRAIAVRDSATSLIRSAEFQQRFPSGAGTHSSGFLWLDLSSFADVLAATGNETLGFGGNAEPVLIVITGQDDEIRWASRTRLTSLIFDLLLI